MKSMFLMVMGIFLFMSCQSGRAVKRLSDDDRIMFAMIYDQSGNPVSGAGVYINDKRTVTSDIQGRFVLENMKRDTYKIRLEKNGYENLEEEFEYVPMQVLYLKMIDSAGLLNLAEYALDNNKLNEAEAYVKRALAIEPNRTDLEFLWAIVSYRQQDHDKAREILDDMVRAGRADKAVFLLLDDLSL